ncbi:MAG: transketolase C-terminal domain-containing protein [Candidatus Bathyarchaeia archaeon]
MTSGILRDKPGKSRQMIEAHNEALVDLAEANDKIVLLYADFPKGTAGQYYRSKFPDKFYDLGIAEANMVTVAAGLAEAGKIPYTHCHSVFAVGRAYNQIRQIAFDRFNVKMILCNSGIFWSFMGGSHQAVEDVPALRAIPNLTVISPSDPVEAKKATIAAADYPGPIAIRLAEPPVPTIYSDEHPFTIGRALTLRDGDDVTLVCIGIMVHTALEAADLLSKMGVSARVIDMHTVKPLDEEAIIRSANETGAIVTVEDTNIIGGLGGAVAELTSETVHIPIRRVGVKDRFGQTGSPAELALEYGLSSTDIVEAAIEVMSRRG